jgi:hypothetical protein
MKAAEYGRHTNAYSAFVSTNSICQGQQVPILWPLVFRTGHKISFAHTSFKWNNLASHNAGVTVVIVGISNQPSPVRRLFSIDEDGETIEKKADNINAYLTIGANSIVIKESKPLNGLATMDFGSKPVDGGNLFLDLSEKNDLISKNKEADKYIHSYLNSEEFINGKQRFCLCVRLEMRFSYSNTLGWNTFPVPALTTKNKEDLTRCAEEILMARERHFPATIANLYDPEAMPEDLRRAHNRKLTKTI